ncbi:hypothetical protein DFA_10374 [Cavenderia fasciculata]|uniref:Stress-response A/B barrel domain-containing protein n=1 Tax=Cavenderia fasciculata TaxID=261658 RepID=F4QA13_CACFS|nr:uncharacterized protein DFA_10374 [Cavenderia fasciculata]EGG15532.1 hypothetical protein DFA_10374 [Cavenderia fasciculata]|eukprot:XP_004354274.1 hypothetical protein DFA_10374 [Cavenderia fasciculata]
MAQYVASNTNTNTHLGSPPQQGQGVQGQGGHNNNNNNNVISPFFGSPPPALIMTATPQQLQQQQQQQQQQQPLSLEEKVDKLIGLNSELHSLATNHKSQLQQLQQQQQQQVSLDHLDQQQQQQMNINNMNMNQQLTAIELINRVYTIKGEIQLLLRELSLEATQKGLLTAVPFIDPNSQAAKDPLSVATYDSLQKQLTNEIITKQQQLWEEASKDKDKLARNVERAKIAIRRSTLLLKSNTSFYHKSSFSSNNNNNNNNNTNMSHSLEHILFMKLKNEMSEQENNGLVNKIEQMKSTIPGVLAINFGKNIEITRGGGYNYGYRVLLRDPSDLPVYADHPLHIEFKGLLDAVRVDAPIVSDFLIPKVNQ